VSVRGCWRSSSGEGGAFCRQPGKAAVISLAKRLMLLAWLLPVSS
jgi:hypothetical protein